MNDRSIKKSIWIAALIVSLVKGVTVLAVPSALQPLDQELLDISAAELEHNAHYAKGNDVGIQHGAMSPRYRASESTTGFLTHDETDFKSKGVMPFEYFGRLSKNKMEESYFSDPTIIKKRTEQALNSPGGAWYQMLMFQEPTLAVSGASLLNIANSKIAEYQRDRANELIYNSARSDVMKGVIDEYERCMASQVIGSPLGTITGFVFGQSFSQNSVEAAKAHCESQISTAKFLTARDAVGINGCEWSSLVMWGHLSFDATLNVALRMRQQFGDDELCPALHTASEAGQYIAYEFKNIAPSFSTRQVWFDKYEESIFQLKLILEQAAHENGGYNLTPTQLAFIAIRPGLKVTQDLITAIDQGFEPNSERPELVNWWAREKANAFVDATCSEARIAVYEAASSQATDYERKRWMNRVKAVCGPIEELKREMAEIVEDKEVFSRILTEGDKAGRKFSEAFLAQPHANSQRGADTKGTWVWEGGLSPDKGKDPS